VHYTLPDSGEYVGPQVGNVIFSDDFENGLGQWVLGHGGVDTTDDWYLSTSISHSPTHCIRNGIYHNNEDSWFQMANGLDFTNYININVMWWEVTSSRYNEDFFRPEISTNGGGIWSPLINAYSDDIYPWRQRVINLTQYCNNTDVRLKFRFTSNESLTNGGWFFDDISIIAVPNGVMEMPLPDTRNRTLRLKCYPNPCRKSLSILCHVPTNGHVNLTIYNNIGQRVQVLCDGFRSTGNFAISWDCRNSVGVGVSTGIYICKLSIGSISKAQTLIIVK